MVQHKDFQESSFLPRKLVSACETVFLHSMTLEAEKFVVSYSDRATNWEWDVQKVAEGDVYNVYRDKEGQQDIDHSDVDTLLIWTSTMMEGNQNCIDGKALKMQRIVIA